MLGIDDRESNLSFSASGIFAASIPGHSIVPHLPWLPTAQPVFSSLWSAGGSSERESHWVGWTAVSCLRPPVVLPCLYVLQLLPFLFSAKLLEVIISTHYLHIPISLHLPIPAFMSPLYQPLVTPLLGTRDFSSAGGLWKLPTTPPYYLVLWLFWYSLTMFPHLLLSGSRENAKLRSPWEKELQA